MTWNSQFQPHRIYDDIDLTVGNYQFNKKKNMPDKLAFLTSTRFYAIVIAAVSIYLKMKGWIGEPEMLLISTIAGGFTFVKTVDKNVGEANISAAQITAGAPVIPPINNSSTM